MHKCGLFHMEGEMSRFWACVAVCASILFVFLMITCGIVFQTWVVMSVAKYMGW